jgi:methionyl-tRNA synthetase
MSKTIGNVIDPFEITEKYGTDALRYYLLSEISPFSDGDFSVKRLEEVYNADLANGLGNLISRVSKLCESAGFRQSSSPKAPHLIAEHDEYRNLLEEFKFNEAISLIWSKIKTLDKFINEEKPWELLKLAGNRKGRDLNSLLSHAVDQITEIGLLLELFLPEASNKIRAQFSKQEIKQEKPLFPRI